MGIGPWARSSGAIWAGHHNVQSLHKRREVVGRPCSAPQIEGIRPGRDEQQWTEEASDKPRETRSLGVVRL